MANLRETQTWENGIYQIEKTDPVVGGADGISNKQAQQLANRTAYLKQQVESKANKTDLTNGLNGKANSSHTHTMSKITDLAAAMNAKANLASPTFTGIPRTTTPTSNASDEQIANVGFVKTAIAALVGSAPEALDTLEELSNALANDANLKQTLLTEIGKKANASHNHTMSQITDFELKQLSTEDLDTVKKAGMYGQQASANATTARHYPETQAGALLVMPSAYGWMQIYIAHSTYRIYIRNANNSGGWLSWVRMDGRDKLNSSDFTNFKNLLVGIPFPYPLAAVPSGCLAFNGQTFNKSAYPILAQKYPSGVLPDLRGEFIRGWDNGRGVDNGRSILSSQGDAKKQTSFEFSAMDIANSSNAKLSGEGKTNTLQWSQGGGNGGVAGWSNRNVGKFNSYAGINPSAGTSGYPQQINDMTYQFWVGNGTETRPHNIAFQYICLAA